MSTPRAIPPSAEELAAAMRNGLDGRRFFHHPAPLPRVPAPPAAFLPQLSQLASLIEHTNPPATGLSGRLGRLIRRAVKRLMNPWLHRQTQFNHTTATYLQSVHDYLIAVSERTQAMQSELARQATTSRAQMVADVCCVRHADDVPPKDPVRVVEGLFLDTRLPPPPARVLMLTQDGMDTIDLAGRGYQVVHTTDSVEPFPDESFDVAVALAGDRANGHPTDLTLATLARVLTPNGRVIGSGSAQFASRFGPLRVVERVYATRASHGWSLALSGTDKAELTLWVATKN